MDDRQIDALAGAIAGRLRTRRATAGGILAALLPGVAAARPQRDSGTGKTKGKDKGKGKGHGQKPPPKRPGHMGSPPAPGHDDCDDFFSEPELVRDCKSIRRTCPAGRLCIHAIDSAGNDDRGVSCCPDHKECCIFGCTNTNTDTKNCGMCGIECSLEQSCRDGDCVCDDALCLPGGACCNEVCCGGPNFPSRRCCDGQCLDVGSDPTNCGGCGRRCGAGQICRNGDCVCNDAACPHGQRCIKNDQYYCSGDADPACVCGCGTGFKYCKDLFGGVCVSQRMPDC